MKKSRGIYIYLSASLVVLAAILIVVRPDLFSFFKYHNIYNSVIGTLPKKEGYTSIQEQPPPKSIGLTAANQANPTTGKDIVAVQQPLKSDSSPVLLGASTSTQDLGKNEFKDFSTKGRVFSWKDQNGKYHFSNTNFPLDSDTLQVQTEINTYHKATKINIIGDRIFVPVVIGNNGRELKLNMLLDTGCNQTTLSFRDLDKVKPVYLGNVTSRMSNGSKVSGKEAKIDYIRVGSKRLDNVTVTGQSVAGSSNSGLLGIDFLKNGSFKIDFANHFIIWM